MNICGVVFFEFNYNYMTLFLIIMPPEITRIKYDVVRNIHTPSIKQRKLLCKSDPFTCIRVVVELLGYEINNKPLTSLGQNNLMNTSCKTLTYYRREVCSTVHGCPKGEAAPYHNGPKKNNNSHVVYFSNLFFKQYFSKRFPNSRTWT